MLIKDTKETRRQATDWEKKLQNMYLSEGYIKNLYNSIRKHNQKHKSRGRGQMIWKNTW